MPPELSELRVPEELLGYEGRCSDWIRPNVRCRPIAYILCQMAPFPGAIIIARLGMRYFENAIVIADAAIVDVPVKAIS